jgi:hypothetical protein
VIGLDRKKFTIHIALVVHHSPILAVMMMGRTSEAQDGRATLKDVDEQAFVRFCEYAYTNDYTPAPHEIVIDLSMVDEDIASANDCSDARLDSFPSPPTKDVNDSFLEWRMSRKNQKGSKNGAISNITIDRPCVYCGYSSGK